MPRPKTTESQLGVHTDTSRFLRRGIVLMCLLLMLLIGITFLLEYMHAAMLFSSQFYSPTTGWHLGEQQPWLWLHRYGTIPGFIATLAVLLCWYLIQHFPRWAGLRRYLLVFGLVPVIGAGLLVNALLKEHSGRPRPREVVEFGGRWDYQPALEFGTPGKGRSFPCGHCTMGFMFTAGIVFWRRSRWIAWISLVTGLLYGGIISATRIVQGGHFLSDALWSLGIIWITLILLYYFVFQPPLVEHQPFTPLNPRGKLVLLVGVILFLVIMSALYLTRRPFYQDHRQVLPPPDYVESLEIHTNLEPGSIHLSPLNSRVGELYVQGRGYALPDAEFSVTLISRENQETLRLELALEPRGFFAELTTHAKFLLPMELIPRTKISPLPVPAK